MACINKQKRTGVSTQANTYGMLEVEEVKEVKKDLVVKTKRSKFVNAHRLHIAVFHASFPKKRRVKVKAEVKAEATVSEPVIKVKKLSKKARRELYESNYPLLGLEGFNELTGAWMEGIEGILKAVDLPTPIYVSKFKLVTVPKKEKDLLALVQSAYFPDEELAVILPSSIDPDDIELNTVTVLNKSTGGADTYIRVSDMPILTGISIPEEFIGFVLPEEVDTGVSNEEEVDDWEARV